MSRKSPSDSAQRARVQEQIDAWAKAETAERAAEAASRQVLGLSAKIKRAEAYSKSLLEEIEVYKKQLEAVLEIDAAAAASKPKAIKHKPSSKTQRQCVPVILASDWHVEERVDPTTVNGLNAYDLEESKRRSEAFFRNTTWMINTHSDHSAVHEMVLWLGGDMITGWIHEELRESNYLTPIQAVLRCQEYLIAGIDYFCEHAKADSIRVLCSWGNHGRTTDKRRIQNGAQSSYEWGMYHVLAKYYEKNPKVSFRIADGQLSYQQIYDWNIRFTHGESIGYQGGVGGITIPFRKKADSWNQATHADLTCIGHFHQFTHGYSDLLSNSSLIGWNAYATALGARFEHPRQVFFLVDKSRGFWNLGTVYVTDEGRTVSHSSR